MSEGDGISKILKPTTHPVTVLINLRTIRLKSSSGSRVCCKMR